MSAGDRYEISAERKSAVLNSINKRRIKRKLNDWDIEQITTMRNSKKPLSEHQMYFLICIEEKLISLGLLPCQ